MIGAFRWTIVLALFVSMFMFTHTKLKKENFPVRVLVSAAIFVLHAVLLNTLLTGGTMKSTMAIRFAGYILLVLILRYCWQVKWSYAAYYGMWSFIVWQLLYELCIYILSKLGIDTAGDVSALIITVFVFVSCYGVAAATFAKWMTKDITSIGPRQLSSGLLIFFNFELIGVTQGSLNLSATDSRWELLFLAQVLIAVILYLQNEVFRKSALRQELELINILHKKEFEQYQLTKENIELINQKCHDLKHQIRAIRNMDKADIDSYLDEIEQSVNIYQAVAHTGNEVLDTILTEKSLYCANHGITISCVADGSQLEFINTIDLYTLLGNSLDNAIEAVEKFEEKDKRQIDVVIFRQAGFVVVNIINPAPEGLEFGGEIPLTTKVDKDYHGYGIKSMQHIVKKYDGFMNIKTEDGCFVLEILFPV